ncbi:MAG: ABC transporter ATP-binding protein [Bdellovibrionales bacterium]
MNKTYPILSGFKISKTYQQDKGSLKVLKEVDLEIQSGDLMCIMGASGAGKSTLLHILGTLDHATQGDVFFKGEKISQLDEAGLANFRLKNLGFVFQFHQLMAEFTALENIAMPGHIAQWKKKEAREKAEHWGERLGVKDRLHHYPSELSGGERQRVAIARSLIMEPEILLADEPTGNLDSKNTAMIQETLFELHQSLDLTVVAVSHDRGFSEAFPIKKVLKDGQWDREIL